MRKNLLFKISGISCALLLTAILVLSILNVRSIQTSSLEAAVIMGRNKLTGDIASFQDNIALKHGQISFSNDELVDEQGNSLTHNYTIVDHISSLLGVHATIFMRDGDDYRRIATSIVDGSGKRAVDTYLGTGSAAYNPVRSGNDYFGNAVILGENYLAAYRPIFAGNSREIIGILFIGIEMSSINKYIIGSIDMISRSTENVLGKFGAIDSDVKIVADQEETIRNAMEEQGEGSKQVLEGIAEVNDITRQVKNSSNKMLAGAQEVIKESQNLEKATQEITSGMNEMASGAEQINIAVHQVNEISTKNRNGIEILMKEVSRFKVE